jgi:amidase
VAAFPEYADHDAVGLAQLVRLKAVTANEVLEAALEACDRVNGNINAVTFRCDDEARSAAPLQAGSDGPFAGVPFLIKDLGAGWAGKPLTMGSRLFKDYVPTENGAMVAAFLGAGLNPFGKTNVPEFGFLPVTESELHGPCRNPWDLSRTPGGSSGGAAAAVAAGIVPMAHASDGGGSIRIPASCCGLFGLKPSRGLNPDDPPTDLVLEEFQAEHVVSRSVRDTAHLLDAIATKGAGTYAVELERPRLPLRVGVARSAMLAREVHPDVRAGLDATAALLQQMGHRVEEAEPDVDYGEAAMAFLTHWSIGAIQILIGSEQITGRKATRKDIEFSTAGLAAAGMMMKEADYEWAQGVKQRFTAAFDAFLQTYDVLLTPTLAKPPLRIGETRIKPLERLVITGVGLTKLARLMKALLREFAAKEFAFAAFTAPFNMTGQPAMSVPLHWTAGGLPIGMQFAAKRGADGLLLNLARQLEVAQPWAHRRP